MACVGFAASGDDPTVPSIRRGGQGRFGVVTLLSDVPFCFARFLGSAVQRAIHIFGMAKEALSSYFLNCYCCCGKSFQADAVFISVFEFETGTAGGRAERFYS